MERALNLLVPEKWNQEFFKHTYEGGHFYTVHKASSSLPLSLLSSRSAALSLPSIAALPLPFYLDPLTTIMILM